MDEIIWNTRIILWIVCGLVGVKLGEWTYAWKNQKKVRRLRQEQLDSIANMIESRPTSEYLNTVVYNPKTTAPPNFGICRECDDV